MTTTEVFKLIDAGFTKEDIFKLDGGAQLVPEQQPDEQKKDPTKEQPKQPEQTVPDQTQPSGVILSDDQFKALLQQLNVKGASLDVPPEADITKKLGDHFKEIVIGK